MCLIAFASGVHPQYPLVLAANRDEFYDRPTARAGWWPDALRVYGGRDLSAGGSWLALDRRGRLAALTNVRDGLAVGGRLSRGLLVAAQLEMDDRVGERAEQRRSGRGAGPHAGHPDIAARAPGGAATIVGAAVGGEFDAVGDWGRDHAGFNLLRFDLRGLIDPAHPPVRAAWCSNRVGAHARWSPGGQSKVLGPGLYTLSNAVIDVPWPKSQRLAGSLEQALTLASRQSLIEALLDALADQRTAPDACLPRTGVGLERERMLSPVFIAGPGYGTRTSTVILVDREGRVDFVERDATPGADEPAVIATHFKLDAAASTRGDIP